MLGGTRVLQAWALVDACPHSMGTGTGEYLSGLIPSHPPWRLAWSGSPMRGRAGRRGRRRCPPSLLGPSMRKGGSRGTGRRRARLEAFWGGHPLVAAPDTGGQGARSLAQAGPCRAIGPGSLPFLCPDSFVSRADRGRAPAAAARRACW